MRSLTLVILTILVLVICGLPNCYDKCWNVCDQEWNSLSEDERTQGKWEACFEGCYSKCESNTLPSTLTELKLETTPEEIEITYGIIEPENKVNHQKPAVECYANCYGICRDTWATPLVWGECFQSCIPKCRFTNSLPLEAANQVQDDQFRVLGHPGCFEICSGTCAEEWNSWPDQDKTAENWANCFERCIPGCESGSLLSTTKHPERESTTTQQTPDYTDKQHDQGDQQAIFSKFKDQLLDSHNERRKAHGVSPLEYDASLAQEAQAYAERLAQLNQLKHRCGLAKRGIGENLHYAIIYPVDGKIDYDTRYGDHTTRDWYCEIRNYDYGSRKSNGGVINHFLQVVWKETTKVGFGIAAKPKHDDAWNAEYFVIVARYSPKGVVVGQHEENVPMPLEEYSKYCANA
ncbi:hypothetical protein ACOME3_003893 [Neoechinorhynchus agilis]